MYVRDLGLDPKLVLQRAEDVLVENALLTAARVGGGWVKSFRAADFFALTVERLANNPYWLITMQSEHVRG